MPPAKFAGTLRRSRPLETDALCNSYIPEEGLTIEILRLRDSEGATKDGFNSPGYKTVTLCQLHCQQMI